MCYPCTMCNRCGKFDEIRRAPTVCPVCKTKLGKDRSICPRCGFKLPLPPGRESMEG